MQWSRASDFAAGALPHGEIHVYCADLDQQNLDDLLPLLSEDELTRAKRFHFDVDRRRFIARRGQLRLLLSRYLNTAPAQITFAYSAHGKPCVPDTTLHFNLSDSEHLALYVFAHVPIGIDIEQLHEMTDMDDVAAVMFSQNENAVYRALPDQHKIEGFFNCWTRKEAFIKAVGEGLSYPLADFDVTLKPNEAAKILRIRGDEQAGVRWSLVDLYPAPGFCGVLAVEQDRWSIRCFQLPSE